jgi:hypothetical protein
VSCVRVVALIRSPLYSENKFTSVSPKRKIKNKKMKTLKLIMIVVFLSGALKSQVSVNVSVGSPPLWGPVGYTEVQYYYLPDVEAYYDVHTAMFIYYDGGVWIRRSGLPVHYRYYDLYNGYKVVLTDYRGNEPYIHFKDHKVKYFKGYKGGPQKTIGEKPGKGNNRSNGTFNKKGNKKSQVNDNGNAVSNGNEKKGGNSNGGGKSNQGGGKKK